MESWSVPLKCRLKYVVQSQTLKIVVQSRTLGPRVKSLPKQEPGRLTPGSLTIPSWIYKYNSQKKFYTSISTLGQKLILTLLNNEFVSKILNLTPFRLKYANIFGQKTVKVSISSNWDGNLWVAVMSIVVSTCCPGYKWDTYEIKLWIWNF